MSFQVSPPSVLLYTPPLSLFSTIAQTILLFTGETVTPIFPKIPLANPSFFDISSQVSPLSILFQSAEPPPPLLKLYGVLLKFQVDAYRIRGLVASIIKSTAPAFSFTKSFFSQVFPPSVLL